VEHAGQAARIRFDAADFDASAELREVEPGHWAATGTGPER
jgi:hypothetical protein